MTDSSDEDSFHSASDGEQNLELDSTASLSTSTSSPRTSNFKDSKDSNDGFEKIEKPTLKNDDALFKVPELPASCLRKQSDSKSTNAPNTATGQVTRKSAKSAVPAKSGSNPSSGEEDENDWFKAQIDEFQHNAAPVNKAKTSRQVAASEEKRRSTRKSSESEDDKSVKKSIWDWTGIHNVVSAVGEGLSSAVEVGLGFPHADEMARLSVAERRKLLEGAQHMKEPEPSLSSDEGFGPADQHHGLFRAKKSSTSRYHQQHHQQMATDDERPLSTLLDQQHHKKASSTQNETTTSSGVGGFFSGTGIFSNLVSAPLDVLESLGKKTFETLTVKEEGESGEKRRFFLHGINASEGQSLSHILRELRDNESIESSARPSGSQLGQRSLMNCDECFNTNFVSLFEKHEGMVHLEGLELLSRDQERRVKAIPESQEFNEMLLEFCVEDVSECLTEDFEKEFTKGVHFISLPFKPDEVLETNRSLTQELSLRQAAVDATEQIVVEAIHEAAITALAKLTAHSISSLHKIAQLIVIAKKLPEVESLFAFTFLLCRRLSFFATQYSNILNAVESSKQVDEVVTNIFFECSNACHDVKKALELLRPFFKKP